MEQRDGQARRLEPLAGLPVKIQISLDRPDPEPNDEMRGPVNFAKVVTAIPELVARGIGLRVATTIEDPATYDPDERERLCPLHRSLGVSDEDHVVRPIVLRGRAASNGLGVAAAFDDLERKAAVGSLARRVSLAGEGSIRGACDRLAQMVVRFARWQEQNHDALWACGLAIGTPTLASAAAVGSEDRLEQPISRVTTSMSVNTAAILLGRA
jgi:hypothetical protein